MEDAPLPALGRASLPLPPPGTNFLSSSQVVLSSGSNAGPGPSSTGQLKLPSSWKHSHSFSGSRAPLASLKQARAQCFVNREQSIVEIGSASDPGNRYSGLNQDSVVIQELYSAAEIPRGGEQTFVACIADGHGVLGDKSSHLASKALARFLYSSMHVRGKLLSEMSDEQLEAEVKAAFASANRAANSIYDAPPKTISFPKGSSGSKVIVPYQLTIDANGVQVYKCNGKGQEKMLECGCTCTVALVQGRCVCLADVGDSAAVVGHDDGERYHAQVVTEVHNSKNESELARIRDHYSAHAHLQSDGYLQVTNGPRAGFELNMTRALGHKYLEPCGIIAEPHVTTLRLEEKHVCLVVASDGIWDVMGPEECVNRVMSYAAEGLTAQEAAHQLVQDAVQLGMTSPVGEADNCSAIVVFFGRR